MKNLASIFLAVSALWFLAGVAYAQPVSGGLTVQQAGTTISTGVTTLNFASGATVTSSGIGGVNVTVSGSGGGGTVTSITAGTGLSGGTITTSGTIALAALSANQILGALTATTPSGLTVPSCAASGSALQWTSGAGFGCETDFATLGSPTFSGTTTMTNASITSNLYVGGTQILAQTPAALTTVGSATLTNAQMFGGYIIRTGSTTAFADTTQTATSITGFLPGLAVGSSFSLRIENNTTAIDTLTGGTGVTLTGTAAIQPGSFADFIFTITNIGTPAVSVVNTASGVLTTSGTINGLLQASTVNVFGSSAPTTGIYRPSTNTLGFSSNGTAAGTVDSTQHWRIGGAGTPTIASGACGTGTNGTIATGGNDQAFEVEIGAAATTTCTITFASTFATAPREAQVTPADSAAAAIGTTQEYVSPPTTTALVINGAALANTNYMVQVQ